VATPLSWDELERIAPDGFGIDDAQQLLQRDDPLAQLADTPGDPQTFVRDVDEAFARSGLVLEPFDRFRS
jgi:DNA primase